MVVRVVLRRFLVLGVEEMVVEETAEAAEVPRAWVKRREDVEDEDDAPTAGRAVFGFPPLSITGSV